jgi:DNA repair photolyase
LPATIGPDHDRRVPARRTQVPALPAHARGLPEAGLTCDCPVSLPLVLRNPDLLQAINEKAVSVAIFITISAPNFPGYERVYQMEHLAPRMEKRFAAMERIAGAGILSGTCMIPILPGLCDTDENLEQVVRWTEEHGGKFVLAGGLTLADH